jgi:hypothetical protein
MSHNTNYNPQYPYLPQQHHQQQQQQQSKVQIQIGTREDIKDHLLWSFFNTIFCCCCCGVVGLFFSIRTRDMKNSHDFESANKYSKKSRSK